MVLFSDPPLQFIKNINVDILKLRIHSFLLMAGAIPISLFGGVIARQLGYSAVTMGSAFTALPLITAVVKPSICSLADRFKMRKIIFLLSLMGALLSNVCMIVLPGRTIKSDVEFLCAENGSSIFSEKGEIIDLGSLEDKVNCQLHCRSTDSLKRKLCQSLLLDEYCTKKNHEFIDFSCAVSSKIYKENNHLYSVVHSTAVKNASSIVMFENCSSSNLVDVACKMQCEDSLLTEAFNPTANSPVQYYEFWLLVFILTLSWTCISINMSLTDAACFSLLGEDKHKYGTIRLFGAIGFGAGGAVCGWLVDVFSFDEKLKNYLPLYIFGCVLFSLDILIASCITVKQDAASGPVFRGIGKLCSNFRVIVFTLCCIYIGLVYAVNFVFLYWHLEDISTKEELKWSKTLQGLDDLVNTMSEVPVMFFSGYMLRKLGFIKATSIVFIAFSIKLCLYGLLIRPVWVLAVELMGGFTYGFFYVIITTYASKVSPPGLEATTQSLFAVCCDGVGTSIGSLLGGLVFEKYKGAVSFFIFSSTSVIMLIVFLAAQFITHITFGFDVI